MIEFIPSKPLTLGVELELQLLNRRDYNLTRSASDLLNRLATIPHGFDIKPEITESMIEIATGVHSEVSTLSDELHSIRKLLLQEAQKLNVAIAGGGAHPFQHWHNQRIADHERYRNVSELYGYLAKQFTVYGQHIHIGCPTGSDALRLALSMHAHVPAFIALSAASPFYQGVDTAFQSSRINNVNAFPLSGRMPSLLRWEEFERYFIEMRHLGVIESMKDFYWDIRPKPEFGTIEIRACDSPIDIPLAVEITAYAQSIAEELMDFSPSSKWIERMERAFSYNKFQASRFGLRGRFISPDCDDDLSIADFVLKALNRRIAKDHSADRRALLERLLTRIAAEKSGADWLRDCYRQTNCLEDTMRLSSERWSGELSEPASIPFH
ncbi:MAG: hypothetical protein RLY67_1070 [Pseudomonadota bacterium]|jgi:carboxylate-amine ligase